MTMAAYLLRRALVAVLLVWLAAAVAFLLTQAAPGDFVTQQGGVDTDAEEQADLRRDLGLDRSTLTLLGEWLVRTARLDFGRSLLYGVPVSDLVRERLANTATLGLFAVTLALALGLPLGTYSGTQPGALAAGIRTTSWLLLSLPPFVAALALVLVAARTGWFPAGGMRSALAADSGAIAWVVDLLRHLVVPTLALGVPFAALVERVQSRAIREAMREPFVRASRARGASETRAIVRHAWIASLPPVLGFSAPFVAALFSGSFVVEYLVDWPGLGTLMITGLESRDLYLVAGGAAGGAMMLAIVTLATDAALVAVDPRVGTMHAA